MRVVLIEIRGCGPTFLAEDREAREPADGQPRASGPRAWFAAKTRRIAAEVEQARGVLGATVGRVWHALQRLVAPDEHLLRGLRRARRLTFDHPARLEPAEVEAAWKAYLARKLRKHGLWFAVDALLAPLSLVLAIVPGPNVVGYWFLYRAFAHGLVLLGVRRARRADLPFRFRSMEELDEPIAPEDHERVARLTESLRLPGLGLLLERIAQGGPTSVSAARPSR